jgi:hypothetical protein
MKKLEVGDYVKNLSEQQFNKIMELQPSPYACYYYIDWQTSSLINQGLYIDFIGGSRTYELNNEYTFEEFLLRLKNTF